MLAATLTAVTLLDATPTHAETAGVAAAATAAAGTPSTSGSDLTIVQANLRSPQPYERFQADARKVQSLDPDFITYNEVAFRYDKFLAPSGYALWRTPGHYTGASPVAWRTDRWAVVDKGTRKLTDYDKKPPGRSTLLGMRYANWVTLRSRTDDRVVSVVAMHAAPNVRGMPDLRRPAVREMGKLVDELAPQGPVLVGGDFNFGARSASYPADLLARAQVRSTYELLRSWFATGDHGGYTIDFLFVRGYDELVPDKHFPVELNSDHDAVVAGMSWKTSAPGTTREVRSVRGGDVSERRAVANEVVRQIHAARAGGLVQVATQGMTLRRVTRALASALDRGVRVRYRTLGPRTTEREAALSARLQAARGSSFTRCTGECSTAWKGKRMPTTLLVSDAGGTPVTVVDVSRRLRESLVQRSSRAVISTSPTALSQAALDFARG